MQGASALSCGPFDPVEGVDARREAVGSSAVCGGARGRVVVSVEAGYLVVADLGAGLGGLDEHAQVDGQGGPVSEGEGDAEVAEDEVLGGATGFQDAVSGGHAERQGGVVVGDALGP